MIITPARENEPGKENRFLDVARLPLFRHSALSPSCFTFSTQFFPRSASRGLAAQTVSKLIFTPQLFASLTATQVA